MSGRVASNSISFRQIESVYWDMRSTIDKICYFGAYESDYPRNQILRKGLALHGIEVVECRVTTVGLKAVQRAALLVRKFANLSHDYQVLLLAEMNNVLAPLAWSLSRLVGKPFVIDQLFSIYNKAVEDRKRYLPSSPRARAYFLSDKLGMYLADLVIADTYQHREYYSMVFGVPEEKLKVVYVGADDLMFNPDEYKSKKDNNVWNILYFGSFIPLHGVDIIMQAAHLLREHKDIQFNLLGGGQVYTQMVNLAEALDLQNLEFLGRVPIDQLPPVIERSDLVLGIFGETDKTLRVIPHKVFQGLAMRKPVLTADTPAIRELFRSDEHLATCPRGDPGALAEAILRIKCNRVLRAHIARQGYRLVKERFAPGPLTESLLDALEGTLARKVSG